MIKNQFSILIALGVFVISGVSSARASDSVTEITYKVYDERGHGVNPSCDIFTQVSVNLDAKSIQVSNRLSGSCRVYVDPDPRSYVLTSSQSQCGSIIYSGGNSNAGVQNTVIVTDNTRRACRDLVLAKTIVQEMVDAKARSFYSADN